MTEDPKANHDRSDFNQLSDAWNSRVEQFLKLIILLGGGTLSITIGSFLNGPPSVLTAGSIALIKAAWYLLSLGTAGALVTVFLNVVDQWWLMVQVAGRINAGTRQGKLVRSAPWFRRVIWTVAIASFLSVLLGLIVISLGAGSALSVDSAAR